MTPIFVPASDPFVTLMGRAEQAAPHGWCFGYPGVTLRLCCDATSVAIRAKSTTGKARLTVLADGKVQGVVRLPHQEREVELVRALPPGEHHVEIVHRTETWQGVSTVRGFVLPAAGRVFAPVPGPGRKILFIGDSVTCGEGVDRAGADPEDPAASSDAYHSYGMRLARSLGAQCHLVAYGGRGLIRDWQGRRDLPNAPQFFELALAGGGATVPWDHAKYDPDLIFVSLGTNDFNLDLGALPDEAEFVATYVAFVRTMRAVHPGAKVALTEGAIVSDVADPGRLQKSVLRTHLQHTVAALRDPDVVYLPSKHYPGDGENAHPTGEQHAAMATDFEAPLAKLMGW